MNRIDSPNPQRWGYSIKRKAIREVIEDVIPDWIRKKFSTILSTGDGVHYVERHGTAYRVDLLQTPGFNRREKLAYTRNLRKQTRQAA